MYRVVLADDQQEVLDWLRSLLKGAEDFEVVGEASTGSETLRLAARLTPDLVIVDVEMPDQDGFDVTRCLTKEMPTVKVVLISGHAEREYERVAKEEGAAAFIPKASLTMTALRGALTTVA